MARKIDSKRYLEDFDFENDCSAVMQDGKEQKSKGLAEYCELTPVKLLITDQESPGAAKNTQYLPIYMNEASQVPLIDFADLRQPFNATTIFSNDRDQTPISVPTALDSSHLH